MNLTVLPWKIWAVLIIGAISLLLGAQSVSAETYSASDAHGNNIVLTSESCAGIGWVKLLTARFRYQGKDLKACWVIVGDYVILFDETGDISPIPKSAFKKDAEV